MAASRRGEGIVGRGRLKYALRMKDSGIRDGLSCAQKYKQKEEQELEIACCLVTTPQIMNLLGQPSSPKDLVLINRNGVSPSETPTDP